MKMPSEKASADPQMREVSPNKPLRT